MGVFADIRGAAAAVMARARWVAIVQERLEALAFELADAAVEPVQLDPAHHHLESSESTLAFVVTLDAVNFGSGYFPHLRKRPGCSGYFTVAHALKTRFDERGSFDARELAGLRSKDCAELFGQDPALPPVAELMDLFARSLADLGRFLTDRFGGSFEGLLAAAGNRAESLVELLAEMPLYRDVSRYGDLEVPFYKRAQLTCADLSLAFQGRGHGAFDDIAELTAFADNLVPHVLRREGVLVYDSALLALIDAEETIAAGSSQEVEIRAGAVHAVERMCELLKATGSSITAQRLDHLLWNRGQSRAMKAQPRHRTRSVYY